MALNPLSTIAKFESGNKNIVNYLYNSNPSKYSASGYFQITNTTWRGIAPTAGINLSQYPTAMSAPYSVQEKAAGALYAKGGFSDWTCQGCNTPLRNYVNQQGGESAFTPRSQVLAQAGKGAGPTAGNTEAAAYDPAMGNSKTTAMGDFNQPYKGEGGSLPNNTNMNIGKTLQQIVDGDAIAAAIRDQTKTMSETEKADTEALNKAAGERQKGWTQSVTDWYKDLKTRSADYFVRVGFIIAGIAVLWAAFQYLGLGRTITQAIKPLKSV